MKFRTYLALGRVSNLPTVWSNVMVGVVLAPRPTSPISLALLILAMSSFYVGGMFLNDAFDRNIDAKIHPERPIPSGRISAAEVFSIGFGLLAAGLGLLLVAAARNEALGMLTLGAGLTLGALITVYDLWHKNNPWGPFLMAGCRVMVYFCASLAVSGTVTPSVLSAGLVLFSYLVGLTYIAKQETLSEFRNYWPLVFLLVPFAYLPITGGARLSFVWLMLPIFLVWVAAAVWLLRERRPGNIGRAVVRLIAGISVLDALLLASHEGTMLALVATACFAATLGLQRFVRGT